MINQKFETETSYGNYAKSECVPGTEDSVPSQPEHRGRLDSKKKLKKVRSIRLVRLSSKRSSSTRAEKSQHDNLSMLSSVGTESSGQQTPMETSDASPNYMKATSSSHAKESFQSTKRLFTRKALTRTSTLKLKRSLTKRLSGRTELKRKLKSSRSIKVATIKSSKSTRKLSESINGSEKSTSDMRLYLSDAGNKSQRVMTRRLSLKPVRILTKISTFKAKKSSMEKGPRISQSSDSSLHKATCSSTLKDSHFPDDIDLPQEGNGSQGVSTMKVCPFTYCSLHGHHHNNLPPLKRFVSMRRRLLKTQKSMKRDKPPVTRSKQSGNTRKPTQTSLTAYSEDLANETGPSGRTHFHSIKKLAQDSRVRPHDTPASSLAGGDTSGEENEEKGDFTYNAKVLLGETSYPHTKSFEAYLSNSPKVEGQILFSLPVMKETNMECCCIATEKDNLDSKVTETAGNDKNIDESAIEESTSTNAIKSSASDTEILEGEITTKGKTMEPDYEVLQVSSAQKDYNPTCTTDVAYRMQEQENKYVKMWHLMYKHAVLSNTGKVENELPFEGKDKEGREQDDPSFSRVNSSSSYQDYCETDQEVDDENKNVIELVQKAFDETLLTESEDLSSDDHFKSKGIGSDEVLLEKSEGERQEGETSTTRESPKEERWLRVDNFGSQEEEMTAQRMRAKPDKKFPKSWSNLKKLILLKRFVKALEKVRHFNPRTPRHLPSDANLEAEKVVLKHQTAEERKKAEEWMLDHALQKVISKLAPAQRQKVALLVEAFETILPFQDAENGPQSSATVETQSNPTQPLDDSSNYSKEETDKGREYGHSHNIIMEFTDADNTSDKPRPELHDPSVFKERCLDYPCTQTIKNIPASAAIDEDLNGRQCLSSSYGNGEQSSTVNDNEEVPPNEIVNEVPEDLIPNSNTEIPNRKFESPGRYFETKNLTGANRELSSISKSLILKGLVRALGSNLVDSGAPSDLLDEPTADGKERIEKAKLETETLEGFPTREQSEAPKCGVVEPATQQEKHNYTALWYLVYKHMVSGIGENDSKPLIDGSEEEELGYDASRTGGTSISYESTPVMNQDMYFKDQHVVDPEVEFQQNEAIKMVEEAIDSIIPDVQENLTDGQSLTDNTNSDNSKQSNRVKRVYSEGLNQKQERVASGNGVTQDQEQEPAPKEGKNSNQQLPRSWSNLKKVILLRRFIKALEKVRKFNPRGPRYLPIEPDSEEEKVHLRHQDMAERKGTEEWMLDYALRQVVSTLTPARKRKVELLVEAFETVMPTIQN